MNRSIKWIYTGLFFFLSWVVPSKVYTQVSCHASAPTRVETGRTFEYTVTLNAKPSSIASTSFQNFKVVGGPSEGVVNSTRIVNGQVNQSVSYTYTYYLQAEKTGTFPIPGTLFIVDGKDVRSNNVSITVIQGSERSSASGASGRGLEKSDVFLRASVSKSNPYRGEQVILTHKLYVSEAVNGGFRSTGINQPALNGLWSYQLERPGDNQHKSFEVVDGKRYTVHEVSKTAVFPQKSGEITISPMEMDVQARVIYQGQGGGSIWDFMRGGGSRAQDYPLHLASNSIKLNVRELPSSNRPADFSGSVGSYSLKSSLSREELKTNEATNLTVTFSGTGNIQHIEAPLLVFPPDFDVTDPKITDNINTSGGNVSGSRSFEYVLIPRSPGDFTIPALAFHYFDPIANTYKTVFSEEYHLKVDKGEAEGVVSTSTFSNQKEIRILDRDIRYIKNSPHAFAPIKSPFFLSGNYFIWISALILAFVLFLIFRKRKRDAESNTILIRDKRANKVARKRLQKSHKLLHEQKAEEFYIEISKVLWGYMSDKFRIPPAQLSMESVENKLQEKGVEEASIREFLSTLNQCEFARFAPGDATRLMQEMYGRTHDFITDIEKKINKSNR